MGNRIPLQWSGGVNLNAASHAIRDDQVAYARNAWPSEEGTLDRREPVACAGAVRETNLNPIFPIRLFSPDPVLGVEFVLHYFDDDNAEQLVAINTNENFANTDSRNVIVGNAGNQPAQPACFVNYHGQTLALAAGAEGFWQLYKKPDDTLAWVKASFAWAAGTAGTAAAQVQNIPVTPKVACAYRGRMVYANFGRGKGNWLIIADANSTTHTNTTNAPLWAIVGDDVLAANGRHVELAAIQGENIIGMAEVSLMAVGSPMETALLVLTDRSAVFITGETAQTTDTEFSDPRGYLGDLRASKVNYEVGIAGDGAMCTTPYGLCWASKEEVWLMNGNLPVRIGTNIKRALQDCPAAQRKYWHMAYANGVVYLAVATGNSTNDTQLAIQHWRLDMRTYPPQDADTARWWGPQDYESLNDWAAPNHNPTESRYVSPSLVVRRNQSGKDVVHGAAWYETNFRDALAIITFNEQGGPLDTPFPTMTTGRTWDQTDGDAPGVYQPLYDFILPTPLKRNGRLYTVTTPGIPINVEPVWPTAAGGSVVSGSMTYTEVQWLENYYRFLNMFGTLQPTIALDVQFKDHDFGAPSRDKVIRRVDLTAFFALKTRVATRWVIDGGKWVKRCGPINIGGNEDYKVGNNPNRIPAFNEAGLIQPSLGQLAQEYQSRTMRPSAMVAEAIDTDPILYGDQNDPGVVRGRSLQAVFTDGAGYVIDDTNNRIVWGSIRNTGTPSIIGGPYQASIPNGYYANMDDLMSAIVVAMNGVQGSTFTGFTVGAGPWNYDSAYNAAYPYFNTFTLTFSGRTGGVSAVFFFAPIYASTYNGGATVYYLNRCMRLLSMLGFDTDIGYTNGYGGVIAFDDVDAMYVGEQTDPVLASPTRLCASSIVPYKRNAPASISDIEVEVHLKRALPLSHQSR